MLQSYYYWFCVIRLLSADHSRVDHVPLRSPKEEPLAIICARYFTCRMSLVLPNQQYQSTEKINEGHIMDVCSTNQMKKALRETQTLHAGCSKAEPKIFTPPQTPFPGGAGWPKFNQLEIVTTFTYKPSLVRIYAHNFELSW